VKWYQGSSGIGAATLLCVVLAGCHHQQQPPPLPARAQTPNIYLPPPPQPNLPPMEAPPPASVTDIKPTVTPVKRKRHVKKPPVQTATALPTDKPGEDASAVIPSASATADAAASTLGALSPGAFSSPQQQQVADHISAVEHRLNELPAATSDEKKKQLSQVRQFLKQAVDALKTGDAEGAGNLATKAGLLLDDMSK
jgi:hypothetical protein